MPLYALIDAAGTVLRVEAHDTPPPALAAAKGLRWLPVADTMPEPGPLEVREGPVVTVGETAVTRTWTVRPKTHEERLADCHAARRAAYPPIGDQLDAAFKARAGDPTQQAAIDAAIAAVKAAWPKPAAPE